MNTSLQLRIIGSPSVSTWPSVLQPKQSLLYNTVIWKKKYFRRKPFQQLFSTRSGICSNVRGASLRCLSSYTTQSLLLSNKSKKLNNVMTQYFCILYRLTPLTIKVLRWSHHLHLLLSTLPLISLRSSTRCLPQTKRVPLVIPIFRSRYL